MMNSQEHYQEQIVTKEVRDVTPVNFKKQEEYWLNLLSGELPILNLPTDFPRPPLQSFEGNSMNFRIEPELLEILNKLASENRAPVYMTHMAAFNALLMTGKPVQGD